MVTRKKKGRTCNQYKPNTSVFIRDKYPIDEGDPTNIQVKFYTLQKKETMSSVAPCQYQHITKNPPRAKSEHHFN